MGHIQGAVYDVAQTADLVLAASYSDKSLRAWSKKDGALVLEMKTPNNQEANTVAVQGMLAVVGTQRGGVFLVDLSTATVLYSFEGHTGDVTSVVMDGSKIMSGSSDMTIRIWDKISGENTLTIDVGTMVHELAIHENVLAAGLQDQTVRVFDQTCGDQLDVLTEANGEVFAVEINAQCLVSGSVDNNVRIYAVPSFEHVDLIFFELVRVLRDHTWWVLSVALDGNFIVSGAMDDTIRVWNAPSGNILNWRPEQLHVLQGHSAQVYSVSLLGSEIVSGSADESVRIWDANTGLLKLELDGMEVTRPIAENLASWTEVDVSDKVLKVVKGMHQKSAALGHSKTRWNASVAVFDPFFEDGSLTEDEKDTGSVEKASISLAAGLEHHVFLSHRQVDAGDACNLMAEKLRNRGLRVWIDQETEGNLAKDAMKRGIRKSKCYLLFLSKTVFSEAVKMELETAQQEEKPILVVHESDPTRIGFAPFSAYIAAAPASAKHLFDEKESMPFQRRRYLAEAFYKELIERIRDV
ncbi:F-box/WD repeat-containing protein 7 [Hondaea fermentalgiana]|uniref:F-box/WD repeat-containing protein 7 n=1 Tax=Hondaea fermentalgiana TaxID=2315210 RepID=A0A2R5GH24_9STRA|nr:F-box/WD repeat-containing protein 7 [Hondaea fermentalgiana]|eukprot:GBG30180.1 F-box/WD repeat-containing protein 7 [Hondaea fermentalgiana]